MKKLFGILGFILIFSFGCKKIHQGSKLASLDQLAGSNDVHMCQGHYKVKDEYIKTKVDNLTTKQEELALRESLSAVPESIQEAYFDKGLGRIKLVDDISLVCIDSKLRSQFKKLKGNEILKSCYVLNSKGVTIYISKNPKHIRYSLLRALGYYLSEVLVYIDREFKGNWLIDNSSNPEIDDLKKDLAIAFLDDIQASKNFTLSYFKENVPQTLLYPKSNRDLAWKSLKGEDLAQAKVFSNWVFAESFDSAFCNQETLSTLKPNGIFNRTGVVLGILGDEKPVSTTKSMGLTNTNKPKGFGLGGRGYIRGQPIRNGLRLVGNIVGRIGRFGARRRGYMGSIGCGNGSCSSGGTCSGGTCSSSSYVNGYNQQNAANMNVNKMSQYEMIDQLRRAGDFVPASSGSGYYKYFLGPNDGEMYGRYYDANKNKTNYFAYFNKQTNTWEDPFLVNDYDAQLEKPITKSITVNHEPESEAQNQFNQDQLNDWKNSLTNGWNKYKPTLQNAFNKASGYVTGIFNGIRKQMLTQNQAQNNDPIQDKYDAMMNGNDIYGPGQYFSNTNTNQITLNHVQPEKRSIVVTLQKSRTYTGGNFTDQNHNVICRGSSNVCKQPYDFGTDITLLAPYSIIVDGTKTWYGSVPKVKMVFKAWYCFETEKRASSENLCQKDSNSPLACHVKGTADLTCGANYGPASR